MNREDLTRNTSPTLKHVKTNVHGCSRFNNQCVSECCIYGKCAVDTSQCVPVKAARGGRGGRGGGGRISRGGGGGVSGSRTGDGSLSGWSIAALVVGVLVVVIFNPLLVILFIYCCHKCKK
jgi:hypothetical protein